MALPPVPSVAVTGGSATVQPSKETFAKVVTESAKLRESPSPTVSGPPREPTPVARAGRTHAAPCAEPASKTGAATAAPGLSRVEASRVADRVLAAQQKLDKVLELAQSGKTFTTAELLSMQAHVYSASQEIDLAGKVVEKATSGLKTLLQTQL